MTQIHIFFKLSIAFMCIVILVYTKKIKRLFQLCVDLSGRGLFSLISDVLCSVPQCRLSSLEENQNQTLSRKIILATRDTEKSEASFFKCIAKNHKLNCAENKLCAICKCGRHHYTDMEKMLEFATKLPNLLSNSL